MSLRNAVTYDLGTLTSVNQSLPMVFAKDYKNIVFTFIPTGLPDDFTTAVALYASNLDNRPDLSQNASASNVYSLAVLGVGGVVDATTVGWKLTDNTTIRQGAPYQSFCTWIGCKFFAYQSGSIRVSVTLSNHE